MLGVGLLTASVSRIVVDEAVEGYGRSAKRSGGALPPHLMVYFAMAMVLFADEDYQGMARIAERLRSWGGWDPAWVPPTSGGITQARISRVPTGGDIFDDFGEVALEASLVGNSCADMGFGRMGVDRG